MTIFYIKFSGREKIKFDDVIELNSEQKSAILIYARKYKRDYVINLKEGLKINITSDQQTNVLMEKSAIVQDKSPVELHESKTIDFTEHSIDRIIKRFKGDLSRCYLFVIEMVKDSKDISEVAEWKGRSDLTYLLFHMNEKFENKIVISFIKGRRKLKIITAMNDGVIDSMDYRISESNDMTQKLLSLKEQLKNRFNE